MVSLLVRGAGYRGRVVLAVVMVLMGVLMLLDRSRFTSTAPGKERALSHFYNNKKNNNNNDNNKKNNNNNDNQKK